MIKFIDGPAADATLDLQRAPKFLRVVIDAKGEIDALDQLEDTPRDGETLHAYRLFMPPTRYHLCRSPRRLSGWHWSAEYVEVAQQPSQETMRDTTLWQAWATEADAS